MDDSHPLVLGALGEEKRKVDEENEREETGSGDYFLCRAKKKRRKRMIGQPVKVMKSLVGMEVGECEY